MPHLDLQSAGAWTIIITTLFASLTTSVVTIIMAIASARGRRDVKATSEVAATQAAAAKDLVSEVSRAVAEIHQKADTAIEQNKEIKSQTDGHYSDIMDLLRTALDAATKPPAAIVVPEERRVRKTDLERAAEPKG